MVSSALERCSCLLLITIILVGASGLTTLAEEKNDDRFASTGASVSYGKIGPSLQIRLPIQPTVRRGAVANVQDTVEQTTTLNCSNIIGSDMSFSDSDLTLSIDDFSERFIEPSMSVLASTLESDFAAAMYKQVYQFVGTPGNTPSTMDPFLAAKVLLNRSLTPAKDRIAAIDSPTSRAMVEGLKALYNPQQTIGKQFRDGLISEGSGYRWYENDLLPVHTNGAQAGTPVVDGANQTTVINSVASNVTGTFNTKGWTNGTTVSAGTAFTIAGVYSVHPETKAKFGDQLQQFVVLPNPNSADGGYTADGSGKITFNINPGIVLVGGMQNVSALGADGATITILTGTASTGYVQDLCFHKNAFAFVTADLELPKGMDMAYRATMDGISMRFLRGYDIINMRSISRLDILYGSAAIRPSLACRVTR